MNQTPENSPDQVAPGFAAEPLSCQRALFAIPTEHCWLNSAYMGPLPNPVAQAGRRALEKRAFPLHIKPDDFFAPAERVRQLCGQLVNAPAEQIALIPTSSYGTAIVAANVAPRDGQNVVLLGEQFPSNVYPWREWRSQGVEIRTVNPPVNTPWSAGISGPTRAAVWNQSLLAAIDEQTVLVAIEQAHWTDGTLFDLLAVGQRCRAVGAVFVIDATQTVGAMPLDFSAVKPDALIVHSYKAMLSNYGMGFIVLSERFADGRPLEHNWLLRQGSDDFSNLLNYQDGFAAGMRRYDSSLRGNPSLISMLEASCELLLHWHPTRIRSYLLGIEREFIERVRAMGFQAGDEAERAANIFGLRLPAGLQAAQCASALAARNIHVSVRGAAVRVSPHVYNDASDLARLAEALEKLVSA